jgi:hypothetical protein
MDITIVQSPDMSPPQRRNTIPKISSEYADAKIAPLLIDLPAGHALPRIAVTAIARTEPNVQLTPLRTKPVSGQGIPTVDRVDQTAAACAELGITID